MLITSWLIILELWNLTCGLPAVSLVDCLGAMPVVAILVFHACRCGTVSVVASGGVLLIKCGAALWVCVLAWSGGVISGCVIFVTCLVCWAESCIGVCVLLPAGPA